MDQTDPFCVEGAIVVPQKVVHSIHNIIISGQMMTTEFLFNFSEKVVVRGAKQEKRVCLRQDGSHISG